MKRLLGLLLFRRGRDPHRSCTERFCFAEPPFCHYARLTPNWRNDK